jgi:hypothetical protein
VAKIFPVNTAANNEPEQRILERLRAELSDEWIVLHSLRIARHRSNRVGEADFVAFTNDCFIVIEVKGGEIAIHRGEWFQNGKELKSPLDQAWGNFFSLEDYLKGHGWAGLPGGAICIFPDGQFSPSRVDVISPEWDPFQCIGARDINLLGISLCLEEARRHYVARWKALRGCVPVLSPTELEYLLELLQPTVLALPLFDVKISRDQQRLVELDDQQHEFLTSINAPRILLNGPAGSGKTILGYKACKNWLSRNPGKTAAMVCSSTYLAKDLYRRVIQDGLKNSFYIYCEEYLRGAFWVDTFRRKRDFPILHANCFVVEGDKVSTIILGRENGHPDATNSKDLYSEVFQACVQDGLIEVALLPRLGVDLDESDFPELDLSSARDFIVVDEGQDFRNDPVTLAFLNLRVKGGLHKGNVIWMQDLNQSIPNHFDYGVIQDTPVFAPESQDYLQIDLNKVNYRNPYSIGFMTSNLLDPTDRVKSNGRGDFKKPIMSVTVNGDLPFTLLLSLRHLIKAGVSLRDVMLVSVTGKTADSLQRTKALGEFGLCYEEDVYTEETIDQLPDGTVRWSRLYDVKGREFPVIILIDLPDLTTESGRAQAYVAATRSTSLLYVLGESAELAQWKELLKTPG